MDKNAIKKYAVWARRELISRVSQKAMQFGITEKNIVEASADSVNGHLLSPAEKRQRQALIAKIKDEGYEQVMEEVAYTWFNRFIALRFMEVNGYLPSRVRVFTDENNAFKPQILAEAIHLEMDGLKMDKVYAFKEANQTDELYKYLIITQCNALNSILPGMFQRIEDYTELLFPDNILREGSAVEQMISQIAEDDWKDAVQIIGWLYQYYNTEPKDKVFADLKKNIKISKENIPAATQLFTPDWIVRYMVENSLGRLWLESRPNSVLKANWKYYLDEAEQTPEVVERLRVLRSQSPVKSPEDIRLIDPCMGSGHILVYAFDVLMQIYESEGYTPCDAAELILEKNLYGLDIDHRAYQLAYFSLMMKARQYNRRIFTEGSTPQVYYPCGNLELEEYGSLFKVDKPIPKPEFSELISLFEPGYEEKMHVWNYKRLLSDKYDVVVTNPPYMGSSGMGGKLSEFVKDNYPDSKSDLFAVFIEKCGEILKPTGYQAMITQHAWMFLSSYEKLRGKLIHRDIVNMVHLGARAFEEIGGEVVQTTAFVLSNSNIADFEATYVRLVDYTSQQAKEEVFLSGSNRHTSKKENFEKIPGCPVAYWVSKAIIKAFENGRSLTNVARTRQGLASSDNNRFLKLWWEPSYRKIGFNNSNAAEAKKSQCKWFPCNKGGEFRKWFGNNIYVVNWENDGFEMLEYAAKLYGSPTRTIKNIPHYFMGGMTWGTITSGKLSMRHSPKGFIPEHAGGMIPLKQWADDEKYILALLNSNTAMVFLSFLSPTLRFTEGPVGLVPVVFDKNQEKSVALLADESEKQSIIDWDAFETSWDFKRHPLLCGERMVAAAFGKWEQEAAQRFDTLKANEEELNRIFIEIYGLQDELTPKVENKYVTVRLSDKKRDIKSLISYAVGCMLGRYSLDQEGLVYAGGEWDSRIYTSFPADKDNIIPICDDEYFDDDIVGRFVKFIEVVYGKEALDENLNFIADALGGSGSPKDVIRSYFINDFYADHLKIYQKRPIYWLFDSGKSGGFKALIYMHRYQPDTIARLRTDYVHEQQARYHTALIDLEQRIAGASTGERVKLNKQLSKLQAQDVEIREYEEKIHHLADQMICIDLDDGVKHNYEIFKDVLAPIK